MQQRPWRWAAAVIGVGLLVRLLWALRQPTDDASLAGLPDQLEYLRLARSLLAGHGLWLWDARFEQSLAAQRTPGLPLLYAACGGSLFVIRAIQALLDISTAAATYLLASRLATPRTGLWAALLLAINPFLIGFSALLLSETAYTAILAWSLVLLVHRTPSRRALGGFFVAVAVLVRPSGIAAAVALSAIALRRPPSPRPLLQPLIGGLLGALAVLLVLTPWAIRNHARLGRWVLTTTNGGITLYDGFGPNASGGSDQSFIDRMSEVKSMGEVERSDFLASRAAAEIRADPPRAAALAIAKAARMWSPVPLSDAFGSRRNAIVAGLYALPVFSLAILGIVRGPIGGRDLALLLTPAVCFTIVHMLSVGSLRYRVPVEPQLAVLAASGIASLSRRRKACA